MAAAAGTEGRRAALEAAAAVPERGGGSCVLCCGDLEATALGRCDHPVCYRCSTKMRVLCEQRYCAVCREELRQVRRAGRAARSGRRGGGAAGQGGPGAARHPVAGKGLCLPGVRPRAWRRQLPKMRPGGATRGRVPPVGQIVGHLGAPGRRWPSWVAEGSVPVGTEPGDFPPVSWEFLPGHRKGHDQSKNSSTCSSLGV